jgi:hypothetical protein
MRKTLAWVLAAAALTFTGCGNDAKVERANAHASTATSSTTAGAPDRDLHRIAYDGKDGETALELLRDAGYDVTLEHSSLGDYVTAIGDVAATKSQYWQYEVDGKLPNVGADAFETTDGQRVEWRYGS